MAIPVSYFGVTVADNTVKSNGEPESSSWQIPIITLTPADVAATETLCGNLLIAVQNISLGSNLNSNLTYARHILGASPAASTAAQRENKWLCRYHDTTTYKKYTVSLPCADLTKLVSGSEFLVLTGGPGAAFKTAFEALVVPPDNSSNVVALDSVQFVGRNS